ncbi:hypothetical protein BD311DRAFT_806330 [Dichomitus squalens]|uniref:HNH nuclease domain-containing protein n=1 Tax=Dichomitus squalens TaxID=114155 RepID=A0A4Q9MNU7_9APHY|nr:hypothetical protein BD311DRAFT_806330 [Dichomitus squalens]
MPIHARTTSSGSHDGSESSLTSLASSRSERPPQGHRPPQTPPGGNKPPGLTFSPSGSSNASSPTSTRSYGLSTEVYPYEASALSNTVRTILESSAESDRDDALYARAQRHLQVLNDPLYNQYDTPQWVRRRASSARAVLFQGFTVRGLIKAMYATAEDLGLERGKRYVSAAICACADDARRAPDNVDRLEFLAQGLGRLASTWAAFMLWPFYAQQENAELIVGLDDISGNATPTETNTESIIDDVGLSKNRSGELRGDVGRREGHRSVITGDMDVYLSTRNRPEGVATAYLEVAHIFKRALVVYNRNTAKQRTRSITATLEILQHYCQLDEKYVKDIGLLDSPVNAFLVDSGSVHKAFDDFLWCLKPTEIPNQYEYKEYDHAINLRYNMPTVVAFKDHSIEDADTAISTQSSTDNPSEPGTSRASRHRKRPHDAMGVELPDPELFRLHAALAGVLNMSGAAGIFQLIMDRQNPGQPPVPSADGEAFFKEIVEDNELGALRQSIAEMWSTPSN